MCAKRGSLRQWQNEKDLSPDFNWVPRQMLVGSTHPRPRIYCRVCIFCSLHPLSRCHHLAGMYRSECALMVSLAPLHFMLTNTTQCTPCHISRHLFIFCYRINIFFVVAFSRLSETENGDRKKGESAYSPENETLKNEPSGIRSARATPCPASRLNNFSELYVWLFSLFTLGRAEKCFFDRWSRAISNEREFSIPHGNHKSMPWFLKTNDKFETHLIFQFDKSKQIQHNERHWNMDGVTGAWKKIHFKFWFVELEIMLFD